MKKIPEMSITARLLVMILPILLVMLMIFGAACNTMYRDMITDEISDQLQMQVDSAANQIGSVLSEINRQSFYVYANIALRDGLAEAVLHPEKFGSARRIALFSDVIEPMLQVINSPSRFSISLYPASDRVFSDYKLVCPFSSFPAELPLEDMINTGYAHTFYNASSFKGDYTRPQPALCITRVIYYSDKTLLGVLNTNVLMKILEDPVEGIVPEDDEYWYSCTLPDGQVLFSAGERTDGMIVMSAQISGANATLQFGVNSGMIAQQTEGQHKILTLLAIAVMIISAALIAVSSSFVMRRTRRVLEKFRRLRPGGELTEEALAGSDEAAMLDQTFTRLYRDYFASVQAQQKMKENQRLLETNLLLSRINPHFLYNTLSAIRWSMPVEHWETVDQLVAFYRSMLGKGREMARLSGELELMQQYIALQRYTYSREIDYSEAPDSGTLNMLMPKFLLQPVFENAIKYGGDGKIMRLKLCAVCRDDRLIITLDNDGPVIDRETMLRLNALNDMREDPLCNMSFDTEDSHGYGIFNVIMRIRLIYGEGYGLWHEQNADGGTRARFVLPVCSSIEEYENCKKHKN